MYSKYVMVILTVTMDPMKLKNFVIAPFARKVNIDVIMAPALQNQKNATGYVTVPMVPTKFNVVGKYIVVGEFLPKINRNRNQNLLASSSSEDTMSFCVRQSRNAFLKRLFAMVQMIVMMVQTNRVSSVIRNCVHWEHLSAVIFTPFFNFI